MSLKFPIDVLNLHSSFSLHSSLGGCEVLLAVHCTPFSFKYLEEALPVSSAPLAGFVPVEVSPQNVASTVNWECRRATQYPCLGLVVLLGCGAPEYKTWK